MSARDFFMIAGEPSGDRLGADLMAGLTEETGGAARFTGIGGPLMQAQGLQSILPMDRLSVMGLAEVLPRLPELVGHIRRTAAAVAAARPDALITIDSPDFCLRVARRARAALPGLRTVHYVAPSVWAWRPGRAAKMAKSIDHVLALLPFEPPYMTAAGMSCDFVGHPEAALPPVGAAERQALRAALGLEEDQRLLCLLPGSRSGEVRRHAALFRTVAEDLCARDPSLRVVVPAVASRLPALRAAFDGMTPAPALLASDDLPPAAAEARKRAVFAEADAALAVSGTVSLELAAAGTPMVVAYRANPLSVALARRLLRVKYASLVNILEDAPVIPEYLAEAAQPAALTAEMRRLLDDPAAAAAQTARFDEALTALGRGGPPPGLRAARSVLEFLERD